MPRLVRTLLPLIWSAGGLGVTAAIILPSWLSEGSGMRFESPWLLLGLIAVPIVVAAGMLERRTSGRLRFPLARLLSEVGPGWRTWLVPAGVGLRTTALALLVLALARPQDANQRQET
ncbi:MAG: BatA domain-containing protein, partial [Deltaproteobacteria bacterium]|nr:BatA domain-containing protein [Deltaproteobacteria bacterium]